MRAPHNAIFGALMNYNISPAALRDHSEEALKRQFDQDMREARHYVENPDSLRVQIEAEEIAGRGDGLPNPRPDPFNYRMTHYRGFIKFPERLRNHLIDKTEGRNATRHSRPTELDIEPTSRCNFQCAMCQLSKWPGGKRANDMGLRDLQAVIDANPQVMDVKLQGVGEPLFNKSFFNMVRYMVDRDIWIRTTLNGSLLHIKDNVRRLVDSGIGEIQTSFDGATKDVFEKIRKRSSFERVVENLALLNAHANTMNRPFTRMWALLQNANRHQVMDFVELAKRMQFRRLTFSLNLGGWGSDEWQEQNSQATAAPLTDEEISALADIGRAEGIEITYWRLPDKYHAGAPESLCPMPFQRAFVSSDLRIVPCGGIGNPNVVDFGPAEELESMWSGARFTKFRKAHLQGRIPGFCKHCYANDS